MLNNCYIVKHEKDSEIYLLNDIYQNCIEKLILDDENLSMKISLLGRA